MKYMAATADEIIDNIIATSAVNNEVEVIACADVIRSLVKKFINRDLHLLRCNISDDDNWQYIHIEDGDIEVGEFYSQTSADVVFFQQDVDHDIVTKTDAQIVLFELKYGTN